MSGTFLPLVAGFCGFATSAAIWFAYLHHNVGKHQISSIAQPIGELLVIPIVVSVVIGTVATKLTINAKYGRIIIACIANSLILLVPSLIIAGKALGNKPPVFGLVLLGLPTIIAGSLLWLLIWAYAWSKSPTTGST